MPLSRIAFVEEDRETSDLVELALVGYGGYDVQTFDRGYEALRALGAFAPDLVLIEVGSSQAEAIELYYRLIDEPELGDVPIVFLAGALPPHEARMLSDRAPVVAMPADADSLALALEAIYAARRARRGTAPGAIPIFSRHGGAGTVS